MNWDSPREKVNKEFRISIDTLMLISTEQRKLRLEKITTKPAIVFDMEMIKKAFLFEQELSQLNHRSSNAISIAGSTSG